MAESGEEKRFEPTPSRIAKARREGNVPKASELPAGVAFVCAASATLACTGAIGACARNALSMAAAGQTPWFDAAALFGISLVPFAAAGAGGAAAAILQNGGWTFSPLSVKCERLHPVEGLKRMLSAETLTHTLRSVVAFAVASVASIPSMSAVAAAAGLPVSTIAAVALEGAKVVCGSVAAVGFVFGIAEFAAARRAWLKKLRMSFDELKRDRKEQEGDPWTRSRRRAFHRGLLRGSVAKIKEASFVVVNPTHVAVALRYAPPQIPIPVVLVAAAGETALRVRDEAHRLAIPIVENVPLARALLHDSVPGTPIRQAHYVAVATIVAELAKAVRRPE